MAYIAITNLSSHLWFIGFSLCNQNDKCIIQCTMGVFRLSRDVGLACDEISLFNVANFITTKTTTVSPHTCDALGFMFKAQINTRNLHNHAILCVLTALKILAKFIFKHSTNLAHSSLVWLVLFDRTYIQHYYVTCWKKVHMYIDLISWNRRVSRSAMPFTGTTRHCSSQADATWGHFY